MYGSAGDEIPFGFHLLFLLSESLPVGPMNGILTVLLRMNIYRITIVNVCKFLKIDSSLSGVKKICESFVCDAEEYGIKQR